jgi:dual specificity protein kinase YAK1
MANRTAFIDFAQGLLNLNPLERWTPNQAKAHPFITQSKFTGPFVPPMTLRQTSSKSPAPGVQEQQRAEALSKQRQQAQQQQQQQQAQAQQQAAYASMQMQYATPPVQSQQQYAMYSPGVAAPPPYAAVPSYGGQVPLGGNAGMPMAGTTGALPRYQPQVARQQPAPPQVQPPQMYGQPPAAGHQQLQQQQAATRGGRQRASTLEQHQSGIPASLQRVMGHLDPNAPIRLQPSPAYYPPPLDGESGSGSRRRSSRSGQGAGRGNGGAAAGNRDFIRTLEDRTLEEGFMNNNHWQ